MSGREESVAASCVGSNPRDTGQNLRKSSSTQRSLRHWHSTLDICTPRTAQVCTQLGRLSSGIGQVTNRDKCVSDLHQLSLCLLQTLGKPRLVSVHFFVAAKHKNAHAYRAFKAASFRHHFPLPVRRATHQMSSIWNPLVGHTFAG